MQHASAGLQLLSLLLPRNQCELVESAELVHWRSECSDLARARLAATHVTRLAMTDWREMLNNVQRSTPRFCVACRQRTHAVRWHSIASGSKTEQVCSPCRACHPSEVSQVPEAASDSKLQLVGQQATAESAGQVSREAARPEPSQPTDESENEEVWTDSRGRTMGARRSERQRQQVWIL